MQNISVWVLPLVGGYAFSYISIISRYHSARETGHRIYFRALFYAISMCAIALLVHVIVYIEYNWYFETLKTLAPIFNSEESLNIFSKHSRVAILFLSFVLALFLAILSNIPLYLGGNTKNKFFYKINQFFLMEAIKNDDFEILIFNTTKNIKPVMFSLNSGKVYIGWVTDSQNPAYERKTIALLPMVSGYRASETHQLVLNTNYVPILKNIKDGHPDSEHLKVGDLTVVIPLKEINNCHAFDLVTFDKYFRTNPKAHISFVDRLKRTNCLYCK